MNEVSSLKYDTTIDSVEPICDIIRTEMKWNICRVIKEKTTEMNYTAVCQIITWKGIFSKYLFWYF